MTTSEENSVWEEILLSDDFSSEGSDIDEELEGLSVVVEAPEQFGEVDHA